MNKKALESVEKLLKDYTLEDRLVLDVRKNNPFYDYLVIATGTSSKQIGSIAERIGDILKKEHKLPSKIVGLKSEWVLVDVEGFSVHLFINEARKRYDLEGLWS